MAIAINHNPSIFAVHRNMAPVYRRRRAVVLSLIVAATLVLGFNLFDSSVAADQPSVGDLASPRTVIANPGDTLWAIAEHISPNGNITELVDQLILLNGDVITAGQIIRIP